MLMFSMMLFIISRQLLIRSQIFRKLEENSNENKPPELESVVKSRCPVELITLLKNESHHGNFKKFQSNISDLWSFSFITDKESSPDFASNMKQI